MSNRSDEKSLLKRLIDRLGIREASRIAAKRGQYLKHRAARKRMLLDQCSMMAKLHKAKLMLRDKGRNGRSMNDAMVRAHGIQRKGEPAA